MCEGFNKPDFYIPSPLSQTATGAGTMAVINDTVALFANMAFNQTASMDGKTRSGTILVDYSNHTNNPNARYYRRFQFRAELTLSDYIVDDWKISTTGGVPCVISNLLPNSTFDPSKTNLSWSIEGSFDFVSISDPSKKMTWKGKVTKTLLNTSDPHVYRYNPNMDIYPISWSLAKVAYTGEMSGTTPNGKPFTMTIKDANPLIRDFTCYPNQVGGVILDNPLRTWSREFHPFVSGIVTLKTGDAYPRFIYFGNESEPSLPPQCDNAGIIEIKGISYKVDFTE
jgi:hypothetical protein